ncbi:alkaline phosphatase [Bradysia coprophila]|uniref:alkaline phosphatase n=1 Tax=Bradysia coprophila TaxID=38358 RepID=UPI00187DCEC8|nr:alkaline phosphatase [Bradysia coprophila]
MELENMSSLEPRKRRSKSSLTSYDNNSINEFSKNNRILDIMKSRLFISILIVSVVFIVLACIGIVVIYEKENEVVVTVEAWKDDLSDEQAEWFDSGLSELKVALSVKQNKRRAKNVVLFVGDGMGQSTVTATRIHKFGEQGLLSWEKFPHVGLLKTYCFDKQVPDSTSTATALFGGVKTNYETGGVDSGVPLANCEASLNATHHVDSILQWAQDEGMSTGFVTTTRVMHATPAALFAHTADRRWECEATMPDSVRAKGCKDIARQLVENVPGKNLNVIMGGGRQCLVSNVTGTADDPIDTWGCISMDRRNLIEDWKKDKMKRGFRASVLQTNNDLDKLDTANTDFVLGIFANGHMRYDYERKNRSTGMPSLKQMTLAAVSVLSKNQKGFILVVEGGLIDQAHHRGWARKAVSETSAMDEAVNATLDILKHEMDESLIIVTADHSHSLSINGYAGRGQDIFGIAQKSKIDGIPYTTLTYATGGPNGFQVENDEHGMPRRRDPTTQDTTAYDYVQQVAILTDENAHTGSDVAVYAIGPMAHLIHKVHEQSYIAHVISYAARIGRFRDNRIVQAILDLFHLN